MQNIVFEQDIYSSSLVNISKSLYRTNFVLNPFCASHGRLPVFPPINLQSFHDNNTHNLFPSLINIHKMAAQPDLTAILAALGKLKNHLCVNNTTNISQLNAMVELPFLQRQAHLHRQQDTRVHKQLPHQILLLDCHFRSRQTLEV